MMEAKFQTTEPSIIFMPLTPFSQIELDWVVKQNKRVLEGIDSHYRMILSRYRNRPLVVWSNQYMPFDNIVTASKQF